MSGQLGCAAAGLEDDYLGHLAEPERTQRGSLSHSHAGVSFVPKGVAHAFVVVSAEARLIAIQTPGAVGQSFYRGASDPATDDNADTLDLARLQATAADNPRGITILGPPPFASASTH